MPPSIQTGDTLTPDPLFNQTERPENRLPVPATVLGVKRAVSQTGVLVQVQTLGCHKTWLDAGWFLGK